MYVGDGRRDALCRGAAAADALRDAYASVGVAGELEAGQGCHALVDGMIRGMRPRIARSSRIGMKGGESDATPLRVIRAIRGQRS
jgi:hypothetical protein